VKGVGSVPVYRQQDDPTKVLQNLDSFRDVHAVLAGGDAVGIFPEGISHSSSSLAPLKTGAARIAIGAGQRIGHDFPIIAVGLVFRDRNDFRSEAHVIISEPFRWNDLLEKGVEDRDAVRALTRRIEGAMRAVTVNLEQWEDEPLVRAAEQVWTAEFKVREGDAAAEVERIRMTTDALQALRTGGDGDWRALAADLRAHVDELEEFGLTPAHLDGNVRIGEAVEWTVARLPFAVVLPISLLGALWFWVPKRLTKVGADRMSATEGQDTLVTHRVLIGGVVFGLWMLLGAAATWWLLGLGWALLSLVVQPVWAFTALLVGERRQRAWEAAQRYFLRRREKPRIEELRERQRELATRLDRLYTRIVASTP